MSDERDLKLTLLSLAGGDVLRARSMYDWVCPSPQRVSYNELLRQVENIARQKTTDEIEETDREQAEWADYEGAYDAFITECRKTLDPEAEAARIESGEAKKWNWNYWSWEGPHVCVHETLEAAEAAIDQWLKSEDDKQTIAKTVVAP